MLELLRLSTSFLADRGIASPRLDAEVLLAHVLNLDRLGLYVNFDRPLETREVDQYREAVVRRGRREPVAYIVGEKEFMGRAFHVSPAVLVPRPETELLVEAVARELQLSVGSCPVHVLDVGTGSGVIAISLALMFPEAMITAVDVSSDALKVAAENARRYDVHQRVQLIESDLLENLPSSVSYDCIVSNPPYVAENEMAELAPEVQQEPRLALVAGTDGLAVMRHLLAEAVDKLNEGGLLAMEIGAGQGEAVCSLAAELYVDVEVGTDYAGHDRLVLMRRGWGQKVGQ